jgi:hypothetical protein
MDSTNCSVWQIVIWTYKSCKGQVTGMCVALHMPFRLEAPSITPHSKTCAAACTGMGPVRTYTRVHCCLPIGQPYIYMLSLLPCTAAVSVLGGGEASGPLSPPDKLSEECFSAGEAAAAAYKAAGLGPQQIDYWGLYDCFPICFVR